MNQNQQQKDENSYIPVVATEFGHATEYQPY